MPDEQKKIILSVSTDTSDASKDIQDLKTKLDGVNNTTIDKPFKSLKNEIKEATQDAQRLEQQFGRNSKEFVTAAKRVSELKDRFGEVNQAVNAFNPDNKLQSLVGVARGAVGAIQGVAGAMAFLGLESGTAEESIKKLQALMAFSGALNSIDDIKNGFKSFASVAKDAFNGLKAAIGSTGIGLLVVAVGVLVANFDKVKIALGFATDAQSKYNKTLEDYTKAAATATQKVSEVKVAFDLARSGVITKKEALQKYNETLGDSFGKTNDLTKAERLLTEKAEAYIKITGLKAQANALFALSAQEASKGILAEQNDQTSFLDKSKVGLLQSLGLYTQAVKTGINAQKEGVKDAIDSANKSADSLNKKAEELLKQAAELGKATGVNANILDLKPTATSTTGVVAVDPEIARLKKIDDFGKKLIAQRREFDKALVPPPDVDLEAEALQARIDAANKEAQAISDASTFATNVIVANELAKQQATQKSADARIATLQLVGNVTNTFADLVGKQTVAGKALAIASATINTYLGASEALKANYGVFGPAAQVARIISVAAVIATGLKQVREIAKVNVPARSGGGSSSSVPTPPSFAPIINAAATAPQNIQDVRVTNNPNQQPIRAYIVNKDLQNNEAKNKFLNSISSF